MPVFLDIKNTNPDITPIKTDDSVITGLNAPPVEFITQPRTSPTKPIKKEKVVDINWESEKPKQKDYGERIQVV